MPSIDYVVCAFACFLSVFLIGWHGFHGASADWVFGLLAILWSMIMMMRMMVLTQPPSMAHEKHTLAQKILYHFHEKQYEIRQRLLQQSLGGSFLLFFLGILAFMIWQIFCASFPAQNLFFHDVQATMNKIDIGSNTVMNALYNWGQYFIAIFTIAMMAFVLRSHGANKPATRAMMIIFASYALAGFIAFLGRYQISDLAFLSHNHSVAMMGNGFGGSAWLMGQNGMTGDQIPNLFDIVLVESGIIGLGILTFLIFVPLATITLGAQQKSRDLMVLTCALIIGVVLILSMFLPFGEGLASFMLLCLIGIFLAWGDADVGNVPKNVQKERLTTLQF